MVTKSKKDFSVAFLLRDDNNNDECDYAYPSNGSSPSKSSCSPPNWSAIALLNTSTTTTTPTTNTNSNGFWLSGKILNFYLFFFTIFAIQNNWIQKSVHYANIRMVESLEHRLVQVNC